MGPEARQWNRALPVAELASSEGEDQSVNRDGLGESHSDDAQCEHFSGSAGITANSLYGFCTDHSNAQSGSCTRYGECEATSDSASGCCGFCDELWYHLYFS